MTASTLDFGLRALIRRTDTVLFNEAIRYGVGYDLGLGMTTIGGDKHPARIFGHCGIGGSVAFGDPEKGLVMHSCAIVCTSRESCIKPLTR